jgi:Cytochrome P460
MSKTMKIVWSVMAAAAAAWVSALAMSAQQPAGAAVSYTATGELLKPANFREWVFLSAGLGMTYNPPAAAPAGAPERSPSFTNVYVNPASYQAFMGTGAWPDKTIFVLEIRGSATEGSINLGGRYQTELRAVEAEVKDSSRPEKWSYYNFGATADRTTPLPKTATCYECHGRNTAVEQTFVQFYPTLMDVARKMGTVNKSYVEGAAAHP